MGAGNSAGQAVVHLAGHARKVILVVRSDSLERTMSDYLVQDIRRRSNIELRLDTEVIDGDGQGALEELTVRNRRTGVTETLPVTSLFVLVGARPHTEWLGSTVARDRHGFIRTGNTFDPAQEGWAAALRPARYETSLPGVFAVGDVRFDSVKRVASAVGEGSVAVQFIHEYLQEPVDCGKAEIPAFRDA